MVTMVKVEAPSILFKIAFEYDITWDEARKRLRARRKKVDKKPKQ